MNNLPRLLLLLLMGSSLLAARWTNGLGQRRPAVVLVRPPAARPVAAGPRQAWLPYGNWPGWVLTTSTKAPSTVSTSSSATHSL